MAVNIEFEIPAKQISIKTTDNKTVTLDFPFMENIDVGSPQQLSGIKCRLLSYVLRSGQVRE